jgi:carboxyl-terminal processing protease
MKTRFIAFVCLFLALLQPALALDATPALPTLNAAEYQPRAARMVAAILERYHYRSQALDDALSEKVFDRYIKALDPEKVFFTQADMAEISPARDRLDDAIKAEDLRIPFRIYDLYRQRVQDRYRYARSLLDTTPDFTIDESFEYDRRDANWAKSDAEIREYWRKRVKNDWLQLRIAGQKDDAIKTTLGKRYDGFLSRLKQVTAADAFQSFMDAYAMTLDPHTNYLGPRASEEFDISMRLSLVGIGAVLQLRDDYVTIRELVPGGPAALSKKIAVGDRIVAVTQGGEASPTEVIGWRLDDVVALIRGKLDTQVTLDILPASTGPDGQRKQVVLIRKKVSIEEQAAKRSIIEVPNGSGKRKIGVITLPSFYEDFEGRRAGDKNFRSVSRDVTKLIGELKTEHVDGIVIDLRDNGGGSLQQVVELTGLFIDKGPVVQERNAQGNVRVDADTQPGAIWNGPLAVLINHGSASASEILAAAIQDYGRGLIIGETSFGKGTVQTVVNMDEAMKSEKPTYGEVKLTVAEFFRINGTSTQLQGVKPDLELPGFSDTAHFGEASFDNALPSESIPPADYRAVGSVGPVLPALRATLDGMRRDDAAYKRTAEDAEILGRLRTRSLLSLKESERRAERKLLDSRFGSDPADADGDDGAPPAAQSAPAPGTPKKKTRAEQDADTLLETSARLLSEEIKLIQSDTALRSKVAPYTAAK